ncbi:MAG: C4-type zinc ribbon domain-containing protein [Bacteroidota bacterium]
MAKELTIAEKLQALYDLQQIDSKIDDIQVLKGELPMEVQDLEDELEGLSTRVTNLENSISEYEGEMSRHKLNGKQAEALIDKYNAQQDNVKNNREYDALMKEIELQRLEIQLSEKKVKASQVMVDEKKELLGTAKDAKNRKEGDLELKKVELEKIIKDTDKEESSLRKKSDKARKSIEDRLLKAYDKIRGAYRNGLAVATVERNSCGGCFNKIPPQIQLEIAQHKKIIACEHCGRILVDPSVAGVQEEA